MTGAPAPRLDLFPKQHEPLPEGATGMHMVPGLDALIAMNRSRRGREARDMADIFETMRACILAEAARADRAEAKVAFYERLTNERAP
jgi:hypothetical protein